MRKNNYHRQTCPSGSVPYTIRTGDTLEQIAKLYNSTVDQILQLNDGLDIDALSVGQSICIPIKINYYPICPTTNYYVVREGDTLESISNYFNVSRLQLYYSNYGIDPDNLYKDQILCVPVSPLQVEITVDVMNRSLSVLKEDVLISSYPFTLSNPDQAIARGTFTILNKQVDPGVQLGARWLGISEPGIGIRGENTPAFIDLLTTNNSVVLSNKDVSELFNLAPVGTIVKIR